MRDGPRRLALVGGALVVAIAALIAVGSTQMAGCCGGGPTHNCNFVESPDAGPDVMTSDAALNCPFAPCASGQTCCIESNMPDNPAHCVAAGDMCTGPTGSCRGDQSCPFGSGLHCCGNADDLTTQCQSPCSGHIDTDRTIRICLGDDECPADLPFCATFTTNDHRMFYGCAATR